jgi:hypothetical protein
MTNGRRTTNPSENGLAVLAFATGSRGLTK